MQREQKPTQTKETVMKGSIHFDERGHLNEEGVALYVDALKLERTGQLPEALRAHVAGCQECRANVTGLYSLLANEPVEDSHPTLGSGRSEPHRLQAIYRIAAVAIAAIGIAALVYFLGRQEKPVHESPESVSVVPRGTDSTSDSSAARVRHAVPQDVAANFRPYEELEGLVGSELRGESFNVTSPGERLTNRDGVTFDWNTSERGPWRLVVLDNRGNTVRQTNVQSTPFVLEGPFRPGLYYWKVIRDDELAHVGKFSIE